MYIEKEIQDILEEQRLSEKASHLLPLTEEYLVSAYCAESPTKGHHWVLTPPPVQEGFCRYCGDYKVIPFQEILSDENFRQKAAMALEKRWE